VFIARKDFLRPWRANFSSVDLAETHRDDLGRDNDKMCHLVQKKLVRGFRKRKLNSCIVSIWMTIILFEWAAIFAELLFDGYHKVIKSV
jgi:hypothetical protein